MCVDQRVLLLGIAMCLLVSGCNREKPLDPGVIETKLADGRVLHYTTQQLEEAKSWGYSKPAYDSALGSGHTHGELMEISWRHYWERAHGVGYPTPAAGVSPPPEMRVTN
jgi:hypothetical protein